MDLGIHNKVALVTGSNRGTGQMIAERLAAEGVRVIFHSLGEGDSMAAAQQVKNASAVWGDISNSQGAAQVIQAVSELTDVVDILVNNYGTADPGRWQTATTDDWLSAYQKNTLSMPAGVESSISARSVQPDRIKPHLSIMLQKVRSLISPSVLLKN
jgi:3-oxoacyl-[acyl-carrier protein] reductase